MCWRFFCCGGSSAVAPKQARLEQELPAWVRECIEESRKSYSEQSAIEVLDSILEHSKSYFQSRDKFLQERNTNDLIDMLKQYEHIVARSCRKRYCPWQLSQWLRNDLREHFGLFKDVPVGVQLIRDNPRVASFLFNAGMVRYSRDGWPEFVSVSSSSSLEQ